MSEFVASRELQWAAMREKQRNGRHYSRTVPGIKMIPSHKSITEMPEHRFSGLGLSNQMLTAPAGEQSVLYWEDPQPRLRNKFFCTQPRKILTSHN